MKAKSVKDQFLHPDDEFSPIPFWFWNDDIQPGELTRQIEDFKAKGVDGFVIHPRMGVPERLVYLSDRFFELVKHAVAEAARLGMKVVLYDEAMYPSGSAHGMVAAHNPMFKSRGLRRVPSGEPLAEGDTAVLERDGIVYVEGFTGGIIRGIHFGEDDGEPNAPKSTDLLNIDAIKYFISLTHDRYARALGEYFGNTVIGMFTDEPCIMGRRAARGMIPWSPDFLEYYLQNGGRLDDIPKLWDKGPERDGYERIVGMRLEQSYYAPISKWCEEHGIALMGHPENSDDIAMLKYFHIPGQDVVLRFVAPEGDKAVTGAHTTQAKCSSDAARHAGRRRNSNECFGSCNRDNIPWNFTGSDMKWYTDWLCVRGVNFLIPHAFYYSIEGQRKYERPPDVGPNNIWWDDYKVISTYMKRLCWLMTDSVNSAKIAVLAGDDRLDWKETAALYQNQVEFNYLEAMYITEDNLKNGGIQVRDNRYGVLLVPEGIALPKEKREVLAKHNIKPVTSAADAMAAVAREIRCDAYQPGLRFTHVVKDGLNFYLFVNEGDINIETAVTVYRSGGCEFWNPLSGTAAPADVVEKSDGSVKVKLRLEPRESVILVIDETKSPEVAFTEYTAVRTRPAVNGEFEIAENEKDYRVLLDLGEGREYVRLFINGELAGTKMWGPYVFDITDYVTAGANRARIEERQCKVYEYGGVPAPAASASEWTLIFQAGSR